MATDSQPPPITTAAPTTPNPKGKEKATEQMGPPPPPAAGGTETEASTATEKQSPKTASGKEPQPITPTEKQSHKTANSKAARKKDKSNAQATSSGAKPPAAEASGSSKKKAGRPKRPADENDASTPAKSQKKGKKTSLAPTFMCGPDMTVETESGERVDTRLNFNSTVYEIKLGDTPFKFHAHESVLMKSSRFESEIQKAQANTFRTRQQTLQLDSHDPGAFEQMITYLYNGRFDLLKHNNSQAETSQDSPTNKASSPKSSNQIDTVASRLKELHHLFALARHFQLPGLQKQVVLCFQKINFLRKVDPIKFFDWAEDMSYEEVLESNVTPFREYFLTVAPGLLLRFITTNALTRAATSSSNSSPESSRGRGKGSPRGSRGALRGGPTRNGSPTNMNDAEKYEKQLVETLTRIIDMGGVFARDMFEVTWKALKVATEAANKVVKHEEGTVGARGVASPQPA